MIKTQVIVAGKDTKLLRHEKTIEIDNDISINKIQNKIKKNQTHEGHEYISEADDNSGTGHRVNSNKKNENLLKLNLTI